MVQTDLIRKFKVEKAIAELLELRVSEVKIMVKNDGFNPKQMSKITHYLKCMGRILVDNLGK